MPIKGFYLHLETNQSKYIYARCVRKQSDQRFLLDLYETVDRYKFKPISYNLASFLFSSHATKQFYDAYDVTIEAAKKLANYLNSVRPVNSITSDIRNHANAIASETLEEDVGLLAIALAAPSLKLAVVQFRDVIDSPEVSNNHTYLRTYWRELGVAWNHSEGAQFWGPPFRDCGALRGRWLWPYSVNFQENGIR